jgi:uncharacterized protein YkwD
VLSVAASLLVVVGLGAYGLARVEHKTSINARQDSATAPCPQRASTGTSSTGTSSTGQFSSGQHGADCATSGSAAAGGVAAGSSATPGTSAKPGKPHKSASATPTPTPSASRHTHAPAPTPAPTPTPSPTKSGGAPGGAASSSAAAQVLSLINQARAQAGLSAYTISSGLDTSSRKHTMVMASGCGLSHQCPGEAALGDRLTAAGVHWTSAGENIGEGGPEPDSSSAIASMAVGLTQDMLNEKPPDDGHRLNILSSSFHHIGIYVFRDSHGTVWMTQDFSN